MIRGESEGNKRMDCMDANSACKQTHCKRRMIVAHCISRSNPMRPDLNMVKVHLILKGYALCNTKPREGGYQATYVLKDFKALPTDEQCLKCRATLNRLERKN